MNTPILDIAKTVQGLIESLGIKDLFKGKEAKLRDFELQLIEKLTKQNEAQIEVNKIEAQHQSIFVAGWRPFIGWVCGSALAYNFILQPFIIAIVNVWLPEWELPTLEIEQLVTILVAMLGFGGYRTYEKIQLNKKQ